MRTINIKFEGNDIIAFENENKLFIYDSSTGFISESNEIFNKILILADDNRAIPEIDRILSHDFVKYNYKSLKKEIYKFKQMKDEGLILNKSRPSIINNKKFNLEEWEKSLVLENLQLNISHSCNMQCKYCYANHGNFNNLPVLMSKEVAKQSIDFWFKYLDKTLKKVKVVFLGGEPLLNKEVLFFSLDYIYELVSRAGIKVGFSLTTNGTLLDEKTIRYFLKYKVQPDISIDGGKSIQKKNRALVNGDDSFSIISNNIIKLKKHYNRLVAKVTLIHEDVQNFATSVDELWELGFTDVFYTCVLSEDVNLSIQETDLKLLSSQLAKIANMSYENIINHRNGILINLIDIGYKVHNNITKNKCSLFNPFSILVTPEGDIYKCSKLIGEKVFCTGNVFDGLNWDKFNEFEKKEHSETNCKYCVAKRICGSGCAYSNMLYTNDMNNPNKILCKEMKTQLIASLELYTKLYCTNKNKFNRIYGKSLNTVSTIK